MKPTMSKIASLMLAAVIATAIAGARAEAPSADAKRGTQLFRGCAACHSLAPDRNMTGPSLAGLWGRKAGSLKSFERYSSALTASSVVWNDETLDAWLKSPSRFIPDNHMSFAGLSDARQRADLIAFLKEASAGHVPAAALAQDGGMTPQFRELKKLGPDHQVQAIRYCRDSYYVTTADGKSSDFWEPNLRLKIDSSDSGPVGGKPVILPAGMMGDRASVFFAAPEEISPFIKNQC
jgi:cytochrome c